ncbi:MAG: hypothetical protein U0527_14065 [Candidatus Eisenbacteria bacterium]
MAALARPDWRGALPSLRAARGGRDRRAHHAGADPGERLLRSVIRLAIGESAVLEELCQRLVHASYSGVTQVAEYGDFSRRGGLLDIFTFGRENPVRIEFDGDEIASIREFDSNTQRSVAALSEVILLPLWEWLVDRETTDYLLAHPPEGMDEDAVVAFLDSIESDGTLEGIEWCLPSMGIARARLRDYLATAATSVLDGPTFLRSAKTPRWKRTAKPTSS